MTHPSSLFSLENGDFFPTLFATLASELATGTVVAVAKKLLYCNGVFPLGLLSALSRRECRLDFDFDLDLDLLLSPLSRSLLLLLVSLLLVLVRIPSSSDYFCRLLIITCTMIIGIMMKTIFAFVVVLLMFGTNGTRYV